MNLKDRIDAIVKLGLYIEKSFIKENLELLNKVESTNAWFTKENVKKAIAIWGNQLKLDTINSWLNPYSLASEIPKKEVLIIMAGNIPLVGLHDFISVIICGHKAAIKKSSADCILIDVLIDKLFKIDKRFKSYVEFVENVKDMSFDAVIATGSNNSARHFDYYFKDSKRIVRRNRRSIAVLDGNESQDDLKGLSEDIFSYFGLGCRNVSKLFLPKGYDLDKLFNVFFDFSDIINHRKYANNYEYNKAVFLLGGNKIVENGFVMLKEEKSLFSPVAMIYYEYYSSIDKVNSFIDKNNDHIQCVVSSEKTPFGEAQNPNLWDYADGVDTVRFLKSL